MTGDDLKVLFTKHGIRPFVEDYRLNAVAAELDRIKEFQIDEARKAAILEELTLALAKLQQCPRFHWAAIEAIESLIAEKRKEFGV